MEKKKTLRKLAEETGISVGTLHKAQQVQKLGRSQEVIDGSKTVNEILREEGLLPPLKKDKPLVVTTKKAISNGYAAHLYEMSDDELETLCHAITEQIHARQKPLAELDNDHLDILNKAAIAEINRREDTNVSDENKESDRD